MKFRQIQDRRLDPPDESPPEFDNELEEAEYYFWESAYEFAFAWLRVRQLEELFSLVDQANAGEVPCG